MDPTKNRIGNYQNLIETLNTTLYNEKVGSDLLLWWTTEPEEESPMAPLIKELDEMFNDPNKLYDAILGGGCED